MTDEINARQLAAAFSKDELAEMVARDRAGWVKMRDQLARTLAERNRLLRERAEAYGQGRDDEAAGLPLRYPSTP